MSKGKQVGTASVDFTELLRRAEGDRELLRELLGIFREEFPRLFEDLRQAVAHQDTARVAAISHGIKGMLANLAVKEGSEQAARLEQFARCGDRSAMQKAFSELEQETSAFARQFEAYCREHLS